MYIKNYIYKLNKLCIQFPPQQLKNYCIYKRKIKDIA